MAIAQTEKTIQFIKEVKRLVESGEVRSLKQIADEITYNNTALSQVLSGMRNVPNDVYARFTEIYTPQAVNTANNGKSDEYKDKYIALLEKQLREKDERIEYLLGRLNSDVVEIKQHLNINSAYLKVLYQVTQLHRAKTEKEPLKNIEEQTGKLYAEALAAYS